MMVRSPSGPLFFCAIPIPMDISDDHGTAAYDEKDSCSCMKPKGQILDMSKSFVFMANLLISSFLNGPGILCSSRSSVLAVLHPLVIRFMQWPSSSGSQSTLVPGRSPADPIHSIPGSVRTVAVGNPVPLYHKPATVAFETSRRQFDLPLPPSISPSIPSKPDVSSAAPSLLKCHGNFHCPYLHGLVLMSPLCLQRFLLFGL